MLCVCRERKHFAYGLLLKHMRLSSKLKFKMADSDDDEEEQLLLFMLLLHRRRRRVRALSRKTWTKRWIMRRQRQGAYANLIRELNVEDPEKFRQFHQLERQHFEEILAIVSPVISKRNTSMRLAISARERLSITLCFLATGIFFSCYDY